MKLFTALLNIFFGILYGLAPIVVAAIVALGLLSYQPNFIGIILSSVLFCLSLWLGIKIYLKTQRVGFIEFMSYAKASPDLDNLLPENNQDVIVLTPQDFVDQFNNAAFQVTGGSIRIFGDWFPKPYSPYQVLIRADFETINNMLKLEFDRQEILEIKNPSELIISKSYIKIIRAEAIIIKWHMLQSKGTVKNSYFKKYNFENQKLLTETNYNPTKKFNISLSQPALMIFG